MVVYKGRYPIILRFIFSLTHTTATLGVLAERSRITEVRAMSTAAAIQFYYPSIDELKSYYHYAIYHLNTLIGVFHVISIG